MAYLTKWMSENAIDPATYTIGCTCYGDTITLEQIKEAYDPWVSRPEVPGQQRNFNSYNMKASEISLIRNWADIAKDAVAKNYGTVMILESDVIFDSDFLTKLGIAFRALNNVSWDFLSLNEFADMRPLRNDDRSTPGWFRVNGYYHTRTCASMVFKVSMLEKILSTYYPVSDVLDWELNYQLTRHMSLSFWLDPPIIKQGSLESEGAYKSTL